MTETLFVREGAYHETPEGGTLIGGRCDRCGTTLFPRPDMCPDCLSEQVGEVALSRSGRLFAWSTIHMPSANFKPPFTVGYVDLDDGPRVFGPIVGDAGFATGAAMRVEVAPLWQEDGVEVIGHRFCMTGERT